MVNRMEQKDSELEELRKKRVEELQSKIDKKNMLEIEIFTSPMCPHCPAAVRATKELMEKHPELKESVSWKEMSTATPEGAQKARSYGIRGVPTIVIINEKGEKSGLVGAPDVNRYYDVIRKVLSG